jgi:hypothetical protein
VRLRSPAPRSELVTLLGTKRTPPALSALRLPLRSKVEFTRGLDASHISAALRVALAAADEERRAGTAPARDPVGAHRRATARAPRARARLRGAAPA